MSILKLILGKSKDAVEKIPELSNDLITTETSRFIILVADTCDYTLISSDVARLSVNCGFPESHVI